ncbi:alkaline phosphatase D family protein [Hoyosella subflava]|uniref:Uncharacterized protein n=1 Tax=Hoyosella subflava (strain DSM 45089 / JCM 17490 / NBRC 109087 / DQS3-9A1) TaxID=443218 RepID=F6EEV7_HOYSD|nr:alkaline phosphatase D family protein [Hoyosella subflava]AEF40907.1 hypothetical protein AS9A_2460 [Hoyosella subflava DQS3-9A1]
MVGPLLRYVDADSATVWVQTNQRCQVTVICGDQSVTESTWSVHGRHFALIVLTGLTPGSALPYSLELDGEPTWPPELGESEMIRPQSVIRTLPEGASPGRRTRIAFGSCYRAGDLSPGVSKELGADSLVALSRFMMSIDASEWPDVLCLLGDQVYADNGPESLAEHLTREDDGQLHAVDFGQYAILYEEAWTQPDVQWLLSTVPTCMILDDHDLRDDWNTSSAWRHEAAQNPHWNRIVEGALSSYCVYQHLGNLSPAQLANDVVFNALRSTRDEADRDEFLRRFALDSDRHPEQARWSFERNFGLAHLVMVDTRCSRDLTETERRLLDREEWQWVRGQVLESDAPHILIGTSLPVLMLPGIHQLEGWNEAVCAGRWGPRWARTGERIRRALDLEHWGAFRASFLDMVALARDAARKPHPPQTFTWLSGDVHSSYIGAGKLDELPHSPMAITQLTMSPFRNPLPKAVRQAKKILGARTVATAFRWIAHRAKVDDTGLDWTIPHGPWFRNGVMTLDLTDDRALALIDHAVIAEDGSHRLHRTATVELRA